MYKNLTIIAFLGSLTIILGAFGAHILKDSLSEAALKSYETAVSYQMYHVIILLMLNISSVFSTRVKHKLTLIFIIGIVLFSGAIYAIYIFKVPAANIWFVTPLGGLILVIGWLILTYEFFKMSLQK